MGDYFQNVAAQFPSEAKAPMRVVKDALDRMSEVIYPAARRVGLPDETFLFPDIQIERAQAVPRVAGSSWMYW